MKTMNKVLTVMTTAVMIVASSVAYAQIGRIGSGGGIGSRLGLRGNNNQPSATGEALAPVPANAVPVPANANQAPAAVNATTPGVTRPIQNAAPANLGAATAKAPVTKSDGSEFVISENATPQQLVEQATSLMATEIAFESEKEYSAWVDTMLKTVGKIADRILALKPDDKFFIEAISLKGQALCYQASLDSSVLPKLKQYADALAKDKRVQGLEDGRNATLAFTGVYLQAVVANIAETQGTAAQLTAAMNQVNTFITEHPETSDMTVDLVFPVAVIAANLKDDSLPAKIWAPIRKTLAASDTQEAKNALVMLEGTIRYSELVGNAFVWKGCDADGKLLDQSKIKGRVVVVDFWASWAEQSLETHKQLMELYKVYHPQGFEIVSYNLDPKIEDMQAYVQKNKIPWIVLSDRATVDAKETSLAAYYGVGEIPLLILIGGDGKVASTDISMESLAATLQSVFSKSALSAQPGAPATGTTRATGAPATGTTRATGAPATGTTRAPGAAQSAPASRRSTNTTAPGPTR